jgi:hypothetical protein
MGKKQFQSQGKYARKATQAKKKRSQKPNLPSSSTNQASASDQTATAQQPVQAAPSTISRSHSLQGNSYPYVASDLINTLVIAGIAFVILVVLYFVL